jgi:hypothetical protein
MLGQTLGRTHSQPARRQIPLGMKFQELNTFQQEINKLFKFTLAYPCFRTRIHLPQEYPRGA